MRIAIWVLVLQLPAAAGFAQSLGEAAQREKKRREENRRDGAKVRVITEAEVGSVPGASTAAMEPLETVGEPREDADVGESLAPNFTLPDRAGRSFSLGDFRGRPLLVDFWATWCGPCQIIAPVIEQMADEYEGRLKVAKLDVDANQRTAMQYGVRSIPTVLLFKDGKLVDSVVGAVPKALLVEKVERHL